MAGLHDAYILAQHRSAALANEFLDNFAPRRKQSSDNYVFSPCSRRPELVLDSAAEAIEYCESHPGEEQGLYFRNLGDGPAHAMLFFTSDGGLILGLSVFEGQESEALESLRAFAGGGEGYIDFESPPPYSAEEFRKVAMTRR